MSLWLLPLFWLGLARAEHEAHLDLISKAQNLTLQHDRLQSTRVLIHGIRAEKPTSAASRQLKKTLNSLSDIFYTEKAQKSFELGQSLSDPHTAIDKYNEALAAEPGNTRILRALARARMRNQECSEAVKVSDQILEMNPFAAESQLIRVQALQCADERESAHTWLVTWGENLRQLKPYYEIATIRDLIAQKKWPDAKRRARELEIANGDFPETFKAQFEIGQLLKMPELGAGERYLEVCQKSADLLRKKFDLEPSICLAFKDVEREVKAMRSEEE